MKFTEQEINELDSQWWEHIPYKENKKIIDSYRKKYESYNNFLKKWNNIYDWYEILVEEMNFSEELAEKIKKTFEDIWRSNGKTFYNQDNFRIALKTDCEQVKLYNLKKNKGCCGFYDTEKEIDSKIYLIGFNFGH